MAERLGEALLDLDTNDKGFKDGIARSERLAIGLGRVLDDTSKRAIAVGKGLTIGAGVGATALALLVKRSIDQADEMSKAAARAGVATEELSRLAWAGELADVSLDTLTSSMGRLSNLMAQMARGDAKDAKAIFDALHISITDADGGLRSTAEVMPDLAEAFAALPAGAEKSALAIQIFGRSGIELIPLLNSGRDGLRAMAEESDRLGKTISSETGREAEEFNDTLTRLGAIVEGVGLKVATGILPELNEFGDKLSDPRFVSSAQALAQGIVGAINLVIDTISTAGTKLSQFGNLLEWMATHDWYTGELDPAKMDARQRAAIAELRGQLTRGDTDAPDASFYAGIFAPGTSGTPATVPGIPDFGFGAAGGDQVDKIKELIAGLRGELDVLREADPVQQRLIGMRETLAQATDAQRQEAEALVRTIYEESQALESAEAAGQFFGDTLLNSLEALRTRSKSLTEVLDDVVNALARVVLQSMLLGQGPLAGMFGTANPSGGLGGVVGSIFSGFFAKGGLIPNGTFGIVGEHGPEPVISTSAGTQVLPNSSLGNVLGGGAGRGPVQVVVQGSGLSQAEMSQAIADALDRYDRFQLPQRVADINADPLARG